MNLLFKTSNTSNQEETKTLGSSDVSKANEVLLQNLLNGSLIIGTILFFINLYNSLQTKNYVTAILVLLGFAAIFLITFVRTIPFHVRVFSLAGIYYIVGFFSMIQSGMNANALLYFLISVLIIALLEEKYYWVYPLAIIGVTVSLLGYLIQAKIINSGNFIISSNTFMYWISVTVNLLFIVFIFSVSISQYFQRLRSSIITTHQLNETLSHDNAALSEKFTNFENALDRRRSRLVTTRQISRELAQQSDLDHLLRDSVELIRSQLGYYYAGIFLSDDRNENALLKAATGEAGRTLLERRHRLRIRDEGIVGFVISHGEPRIAIDVADDFTNYKNPVLPNTRSELAVPLKVGARVIGALDIQSDQKDAFGDEDIEILQGIADQLSTVIDKTTQIQQLKQNVESLEDAYRTYTRGVWQTHLKGSKKKLNYVYKQDTLSTELEESEISEDALEKGEMIVAPSEITGNPENTESVLAVPIILRDQVLGVLNIKYKGKDVPEDLSALVTNASERLALALENARLLEQIQERAEREHLVGNISAKVRSASDIDSILRITAQELGQSLGIDEVRIQLKSAE